MGAIALSSILQMTLLWFGLTRKIFFGAAPDFGFDWFVILGLSLAPVTIIEVGKFIRYHWQKRPK